MISWIVHGLIGFTACGPVPNNPPLPDTVLDPGILDDTRASPARYSVHTQIDLNVAGRMEIIDGEQGTAIWRLENTDLPAWPDARFHPDGSLIYHMVVDVKDLDPEKSAIVGVDWQGDSIVTVAIPGAHHAFDFIDAERMVTIVTEFRDIEGVGQVAGDTIVLVEGEEIRTLFSAFDLLQPQRLTDMWDHGGFQHAIDWTHANCIRWNDAQQRLILTVPGVNALWLLNLDGGVEGVITGEEMSSTPYLEGPMYADSPFPIYTGGEFSLPHGGTLSDDGSIWVLSNGLGPQSPSSGMGMIIDTEELVALDSFLPPIDGAHSAGLGGVLKEGEQWIVNWGILGIVEGIDSEGQQSWQIDTPLGSVYSNSTVWDSLDDFLDQ